MRHNLSKILKFKVANFGGTLGLFLGFSFISLWDFAVQYIGIVRFFCKEEK